MAWPYRPTGPANDSMLFAEAAYRLVSEGNPYVIFRGNTANPVQDAPLICWDVEPESLLMTFERFKSRKAGLAVTRPKWSYGVFRGHRLSGKLGDLYFYTDSGEAWTPAHVVWAVAEEGLDNKWNHRPLCPVLFWPDLPVFPGVLP